VSEAAVIALVSAAAASLFSLLVWLIKGIFSIFRGHLTKLGVSVEEFAHAATAQAAATATQAATSQASSEAQTEAMRSLATSVQRTAEDSRIATEQLARSFSGLAEEMRHLGREVRGIREDLTPVGGLPKPGSEDETPVEHRRPPGGAYGPRRPGGG
jgi:hypothetical protein